MFRPAVVAEVRSWWVVFHERADCWWVDRFVPGRFKHVQAFAIVNGIMVFLCPALGRTGVLVAPESEAGWDFAERFIGDGEVVRVPVQDRAARVPRLGFWCVPAIAHLVGLPSGALRPDTLWRDCCAVGERIPRDDPECAHAELRADQRGADREPAGEEGPDRGHPGERPAGDAGFQSGLWGEVHPLR
jgi:hypothetical protein